MPTSGFHYVYVLASEADPACRYTGCTSDLRARLKAHNAGGCPHTAKYRPWRIETAIAFRDKQKGFGDGLRGGNGKRQLQIELKRGDASHGF